MTALILKSLNHLYKILKVYLTLAILGALAVVTYGFLVSKPLVVLISFITIGLVLTAILLWFQAKTRSFDKRTDEDKQPPKLPESLMTFMLPARLADPITADLRDDFDHLKFKYGRKSAAAWYYAVSVRIVIQVLTLYATLRVGKVFVADFLKKE
jgi:hypothetical protein